MHSLIVTVFVILLVSASCSFLEAVLYSVPMRLIESKSEEGHGVWRLFRRLRQEVDKSLSAIVSLNTIANTLGATIYGSLALSYMGESHVGAFGILLTILILVFGEILPKTVGVVFAREVCPYVTHAMYLIRILMSPFVWGFGHLTRVVIKKAPPERISPEEIRVLARLGMLRGELGSFETRVIEGILSLRHKRVRDVMTPRTVIFSLPEDLSLNSIKDMEIQWEHSRVPVYQGSKEDVIGLVLTKEVFLALSRGKGDMKLRDLMRPVNFIADVTHLDKALMEFLKTRQHLFVVLDEFGGLSGVITLEDIIEEVLGQEIVDESDLVVDKQKLAKSFAKKIVGRFKQ